MSFQKWCSYVLSEEENPLADPLGPKKKAKSYGKKKRKKSIREDYESMFTTADTGIYFFFFGSPQLQLHFFNNI